MNTFLLIAASITLGLFLGWFLSQRLLAELRRQIGREETTLEALRDNLASTQQAKVAAETKLHEALKNSEEQKKLLERAEEKLTTTFQALSGESLKSNNKAFVELAKETLETVLSKAKGEFGEKEESIKNIVGSLEDALKRYENQVNELESKRASDYGSMESQIKSLLTTNQQLQKETGNLVSALRRPEVRGRWGELTLKRVVELTGMSEHCDFTEQVSVNTEEGRIRPDMIVHLPADREIVVDSKVSLDAYMDAVAAEAEEKKKGFITKHAQQLRKHMVTLSGKGYWEQFSRAPELVVMFIPGESFLSAALAVDHTLIEDGMEAKVIIATPTTLNALLRAIAGGWRQQQLARHTQEIANLAKDIYDRFQPFLQHVNKTSDYLTQTTNCFNRMVTSLERRVLVSVRKFKELGAAGDKELPEVQPVEQIPVKAQNNEMEEVER